MSATDFLTPEWILRAVRALCPDGQIALDPCTFADNPTCARRWLTVEDNGLVHDWRTSGLAYVNEPYSRETSGPWSEKIAAEAYRGVEIVRLTRASTDTEWWHTSVAEAATAVCFLKGRPRHATPGKKATGPGKFASAVVYYGWRARQFAQAFGAHGWVVRC